MQRKSAFAKWLDTLVDEKGLDRERFFEVEGPTTGINLIPLGCVIEAAQQASPGEQAQIKTILVKIDFMNGDVMHFFKHLAQGLAR